MVTAVNAGNRSGMGVTIVPQMSLKKVMLLLLGAFAIFYIVNSPSEAAHFVKTAGENVGRWLETGAHSMAEFLEALV
jgi:hypothetical protein